MKRRKLRNEVEATLYDSEDRQVTIRGTYHSATSDYYDRGLGCYLPGDPEDIEILGGEADKDGADVEEVLADVERCEEAIREAAIDEAQAAEEDRAEARAEARREAREGW